MSDAAHAPTESMHPSGRARWRSRFPATVGRFDDAPSRATVDRLVRWVEDAYREDLLRRPSKHVYVRHLAPAVVESIDRLRDSPVIRDAILRQFGHDAVITPMKHTDELYISHYNKDFGGDQGLYGKHFDGNLRFLPLAPVVRALIYLQSDATYKVVFGDSRVERAFASYEFGLLDFHRELHWVEGAYDPADRQRILLKCNYLVAPRAAGIAARLALVTNSGVFYVVKAAMEYSKSPRTPAQRLVGITCNVMRVLNNFHPLLPIGLIVAALAWGGFGLVRLLT